MAITAYEKEVSPGVKKTFYHVYADAINKYTGKRKQKRKKGIVSLPKAELAYRELWSLCRNEKPDGLNICLWGELVDKYIDYLYKNIRSKENPNGFSPSVFDNKYSQLKHTESWDNRHIELVTPIFVNTYLDEREKGGMSRSMSKSVGAVCFGPRRIS